MSKVEEKLREVLTSIVKEKFHHASDIRIKPLSSNGVHWSSTLFEATIVTPKENVEMFAKVGSMGDSLNANNIQLFDTENFVYATLTTAYEKLQDKHGIIDNRYIFSKFYKRSDTGGVQIIVLENLKCRGYHCYGRFQNIDWKYASKCVETLARYHALSFALSKEYPEVFKKAEEVLQLPSITGSQWDGITDAALAAVDMEDRPKLSQVLEGSEGWTKFKELYDPRKTSVIIHGDYQSNNLMHKEVNGEIHLIPVDYQTARLGCPAADLVYFILMGTDQQFRQQHYQQLVDHYYQHLVLAMRRLDLVPEEVYGREEFDSDMKEKLPIGLCLAGIVLLFVTAEPGHAASFESGRFVPRANELFAERFRALVQDFKQWGFL